MNHIIFIIWAHEIVWNIVSSISSSFELQLPPLTKPTSHLFNTPYWMFESPTQKVDLAAVIDLTWSLLMCGRLPTKLRNGGTRQSCCTCVSSSLEIKRRSFNFGVKEHWKINQQMKSMRMWQEFIQFQKKIWGRNLKLAWNACLYLLCFVKSFSHQLSLPAQLQRT